MKHVVDNQQRSLEKGTFNDYPDGEYTQASGNRRILFNSIRYSLVCIVICSSLISGQCLANTGEHKRAQAMNIDFQDCSFFSVGGVSIDLDQTTTTQAMYITIAGNPFLHYIDGATTFALDNAGSYLNIFGMECRDAFAFGAAAKALIFNMSHCHYQSQAQTTGGGAGQLHNLLGNTYYTGDNSATAATSGGAGDFDATSTEFFNGHAVTVT